MRAMQLLLLVVVVGGGALALSAEADATDPHEEDAVTPTQDDLRSALVRQAARKSALLRIPKLEQVKFGPSKALHRLSGRLGLTLPDELDAQALQSLKAWLTPLFQLEGTETLRLERSNARMPEVWVARVLEQIDGEDVINAGLTLQWSRSTGELLVVNGALLPDRNLARVARLSAEEARQRHSAGPTSAAGTVESGARPRFVLDGVGRGHLAWELVIESPLDGSSGAQRTLVDAVTGEKLLSTPVVSDALSRTIYSGSTTTDFAVLLCDETTTCTDSDAIEFRALMGQVYSMWLSRFALDSYDGNGAVIISSLRHPDFVSNGGYTLADPNTPGDVNRFLFGVGDGTYWEPVSFGSSPDFVAHEYGHGVSHAGIGAYYNGGGPDSNPINEGLSDVFAAIFDWHLHGLSQNTWWMFEDVHHPPPSYEFKFYRNMTNPIADGSSNDHVSDPAAPDPHHRAGIVNLAFYKLAVGGGHPHNQSPGASVPAGGVGMETASQIFVEAVRFHLLPSPPVSFQTLRDATADAAIALYPTSTFEREAVHSAWDVVGAPGSPGPPPPPAPPTPNQPAAPIEALPSCVYAGMNDIYWNPPSTGPLPDFYELQLSQTNSFTNPTLIYQGPELSQVISIFSTSYVRVRACNAFGCGAYRGPKKVTYYQTCP